jgi:hypothetical protein
VRSQLLYQPPRGRGVRLARNLDLQRALAPQRSVQRAAERAARTRTPGLIIRIGSACGERVEQSAALGQAQRGARQVGSGDGDAAARERQIELRWGFLGDGDETARAGGATGSVADGE